MDVLVLVRTSILVVAVLQKADFAGVFERGIYWDGLCASPHDLPLLEAQQAEAKQRMKAEAEIQRLKAELEKAEK